MTEIIRTKNYVNSNGVYVKAPELPKRKKSQTVSPWNDKRTIGEILGDGDKASF